MIVIPNKKFIFVRTPKTASTSISHFLLENIGYMDDIIHTPVYYSNYFGPNPLDVKELTHATTHELIQAGLVDYDIAEKSRIFGVVRDPVQRFISFAYHINPQNKNRNINHLVEITLRHNLPEKQSKWLVFNGRTITDIHCFERLTGMTKAIFNYLGVDADPNIKYYHRSEAREDKHSSIDKQLEKQILELYKEDHILYLEALNKNG